MFASPSTTRATGEGEQPGWGEPDLHRAAAATDDHGVLAHDPGVDVQGQPSGSPNGVTPPIIIPVSSRVCSAEAKEAFRTPSRSHTVWLTSSRQVASTTHAHAIPGSFRAATTIVFADCSGGTP